MYWLIDTAWVGENAAITVTFNSNCKDIVHNSSLQYTIAYLDTLSLQFELKVIVRHLAYICHA